MPPRLISVVRWSPPNQTPFSFTVQKLTSFDSIEQLRNFLSQEPGIFDITRQEHLTKQMREAEGLAGMNPRDIPDEVFRLVGEELGQGKMDNTLHAKAAALSHNDPELLKVLFLVPFFRNQVIQIAEGKLILHIFGKTTELRAENFFGFVFRKNSVISYRFLKGRRGYQVTPHTYHNAEKLREMLIRMVGVDDRVALSTRRSEAQTPCATRSIIEGNDSNIDH